MTANGPPKSSRFRVRPGWVSGVIFIAFGLYALACIPAVFVFEHFRWPEFYLHSSAMAACGICVIAAVLHLLTTWRDQRAASGVPTRALAYVALILGGGFLLLTAALIAALIVGYALFPPDF